MTQEFRIGGVLISTVVPAFFAALLLTVLLSWLLTRIGFYKLIWQRPIVDLAILILLFSAIVVLLPDGWPLA